MQSRLLTSRLKRSINNVFLFTVRLAQQPFDAVSIIGAFEDALTHTEHGLGGKITGYFGDSVHQYNCRCFQGLTLLMQGLNELASRKAFVLA